MLVGSLLPTAVGKMECLTVGIPVGELDEDSKVIAFGKSDGVGVVVVVFVLEGVEFVSSSDFPPEAAYVKPSLLSSSDSSYSSSLLLLRTIFATSKPSVMIPTNRRNMANRTRFRTFRLFRLRGLL